MPKSKKKNKKTAFSHRVLYWLSHIICAFVIILAFLTLVQCTVKKPEAPTWETKLTVPLVNKAWDMAELIDKIDQENLTTDSLGNPFFFYETVLDTVSVEGSFSIADAVDTIAESLGVVQLNPFGGAQVSVDLSDYVALQSGVVPPISFDITQSLPPMGEFATISVESGYTLVTIVNDFGLDLDTVIVTLNDLQLGAPVTVYDVPGGIPVGDIRVDTVDLSGKTISNQLELSLHCHTPGATSFSLADKSLAATVSMPEGPRVTSATAQLPQVTREFSDAVTISSVHQVQSALLSNGEAVLDIENNTNIPINLVITLDDIKDGTSPLTIDQAISGGQTGQFVYGLAGYTIEPADQIMPQALSISVAAIIDSSGSQLVTFNAGDKISVSTGIRNVSLASVRGILAPTSATFDNVQQTIELPKGFDHVQLTSAVMYLEIENSVDIPGSFALTIDGDGRQKSLAGAISRGTPLSPTTTLIIDGDLADFLNPVPELLTVSGNAVFGDGVTAGSINADDYITASVTIRSPIEMVVDSTTIDGDWESSDIDDGTVTDIVNNTNEATLHLTVTNHLPVGMSARVLLSGDSATLYSDPEVVLGPMPVSAANLTGDGTVESAVVSEGVVRLNADEVQVLAHKPFWIGQIYTLHSTNGETVKFSPGDSFAVSGYIELDLNVSDWLWED